MDWLRQLRTTRYADRYTMTGYNSMGTALNRRRYHSAICGWSDPSHTLLPKSHFVSPLEGDSMSRSIGVVFY